MPALRLLWRALLLWLALLVVPRTVHAQQVTDPVAEGVWIPMTETTPAGAARELRLEGFLYRPSSPGPYPVLIFNHGSTGALRVPPTSTAFFRYPEVARFFVDRGWAVLIPMRRGRGASGGDYLERDDCNRTAFSDGVNRAVQDLDAVIAYVSAQSWADTSRLLLGGMSRGGLLSVVYPSRRPTTAKGVINFAGGWTAEQCDNFARLNMDAFAEAGRGSKLPMLWLYSENDRIYSPRTVRFYHRTFTQAGGTAELQIFPPIGYDGHILLPGAIDVWQIAVQSFLVRLGLARP
jgi:dienelactone hydrolase